VVYQNEWKTVSNKKRFSYWSMGLIYILSITLMNTAYAACDDKRSPGMDWSGCKKMHKMLDGQDFSGSKFDNANLSLSNLDGSNFTGASLVKTDFSRASFNHSNFSEADLTKSVGYRAIFNNAIFSNTRMSKTELSRASFEAASFVNVDWSRAELGRVNFSDAQLRDVDFEYSNLSRVSFNGAKLTNVNFSGAYTFLTRFENVDLSATSQLTQVQLDMACGNTNTRLPQGLERPASWPCGE
jgi:uncharacterized protein YjbI with pentapeptide repeats